MSGRGRSARPVGPELGDLRGVEPQLVISRLMLLDEVRAAAWE